jgi:predicted Zn-ribbon and HTH transcriptional regulator
MRQMKLQMAPTTHVITDEKTCILCSKDFEYAAIVSGEKIVEDLSSIYKGKVTTDQVVLLKKSLANNGTLQIFDVEITVKCPQCHSKQRFNHFLTLQL